MNYQALANDNLTIMYESIRAALVSDDGSELRAGSPEFIFAKLPNRRSTRRSRRGM